MEKTSYFPHSDIDSGTGSENPPVITIDTVIHFLKELKKEYQVSNQSKTTLEQFQKENETLKQKISELEKELKVKEKELTTMREDYQTFIQIMERARKMTVFEDHGTMKGPCVPHGQKRQFRTGSKDIN